MTHDIDLIGTKLDGPPSKHRLDQARRTARRLGVELPRACLSSWKSCMVFVEQAQAGLRPHLNTFDLLGTVEMEMGRGYLRSAEMAKLDAVKIKLLATARAGGVWVG